MTAMDRFERILPAALTDLADPRTPDYLADVLGQTALTRQRPAWASLERWLPMNIATTRVPTARIPMRAVGVLALIALLVAIGIAVYIGSQPRVPAPFGPAVNGVVAYVEGGVLYLYDPDRDSTETLDTNAAGWLAPWFSPDGRQLVLAHEPTPSSVELGVVAVEGGDIRTITPELDGVDLVEWSPNGDAIIFTERGVPTIADVASGATKTIPWDHPVLYAAFMPPSGERVLIVSKTAFGGEQIVEMNTDGTGPIPRVVLGANGQVYGMPSVSPDGSAMAYALWDNWAEHGTLHLVDLASGDDSVFMDDPDTLFFDEPRFSPDGNRIAVKQVTEGPSGPVNHATVIDLESRAIVEGDIDFTYGGVMEWSPDGRVVVLSAHDGPDGPMMPHALMDPTTGRVTPAPWTASGYPSWQRKAD